MRNHKLIKGLAVVLAALFLAFGLAARRRSGQGEDTKRSSIRPKPWPRTARSLSATSPAGSTSKAGTRPRSRSKPEGRRGELSRKSQGKCGQGRDRRDQDRKHRPDRNQISPDVATSTSRSITRSDHSGQGVDQPQVRERQRGCRPLSAARSRGISPAETRRSPALPAAWTAKRQRADQGGRRFRGVRPEDRIRDIEATKIKGSVQAETTSGSIVLRDISEAKNVRAKVLSGRITYEGQIIPGGRYDFETLSGSIRSRDPGRLGFELDAETLQRQHQFRVPDHDGRQVLGEGAAGHRQQRRRDSPPQDLQRLDRYQAEVTSKDILPGAVPGRGSPLFLAENSWDTIPFQEKRVMSRIFRNAGLIDRENARK